MEERSRIEGGKRKRERGGYFGEGGGGDDGEYRLVTEDWGDKR